MDSTTAVPTAPPRRNTDSSADSLSEHEDVSSLASGWSEDDQSESQGDGQPREDSTTPTPVVPVLTSLLAVSTPAQDVETLRLSTKLMQLHACISDLGNVSSDRCEPYARPHRVHASA